MKTESAVHFNTASRLHIGLEVTDLERSVSFYRTLFGTEPAKTRPGYAKFEPQDPPANLSLSERPGPPSGGRSGGFHYGIEVKSVLEVRRAAERLHSAGIPVRLEEESTCCYAVQTKAWADDPDGNPWEIFVVLEADAAGRADETSTCCAETCCSE